MTRTSTSHTAFPARVLLALLALALSLPTVTAQVRFGAKGGFQLATMDFNTSAIKNSNRAGFFIGPTLKIGLPVPGLAIDATALYDQRDLKVDDGQTFKQQSLVLQGDGRYGVGIGEVVNVFFKAGPQFSFNLGDDFIHWFDSDSELKQFSLQETMFSINVGLGVTFARHFEGSINYNIPISKTADLTWQQTTSTLQEETFNHAKTRTNAWSVAVTYYF